MTETALTDLPLTTLSGEPTTLAGLADGAAMVVNVASDTAHLFFDDCRIPARYTLGEPNAGFAAIMQNFQGERLATTLLVIAFMDRALSLAMQYARERKAFNRSLMENQVWRHRFAEHRAHVEAARWLTYRTLDVHNRTANATQEISMAKLVACDLAQKVLYDYTQVYGGFGYTVEYAVADVVGNPLGVAFGILVERRFQVNFVACDLKGVIAAD